MASFFILSLFHKELSMKINFRQIICILFIHLFFLTQSFSGSNTEEKQIVLIFVDDIAVPIFMTTNESTVPTPTVDTTPPVKPTLVSTVVTTTTTNATYITIKGEKNTSVYVNGILKGSIGNSGEIIIALDTSGEDGEKTFNIVLRDSAGNNSNALTLSITKTRSPKFDLAYKGLTFYHQNIVPDNYQLDTLTDSTFNALSASKKLQVANTLLSTLFFGYPQDVLLEKINSGHFVSNVYMDMQEDRTDKAWLEEHILDDDKFRQYSTYVEPQAINILSRFYAMAELDSYFLKNWIAYILTQTIMFSPAYELESTHTPNIANVYNRIVTFLNEESGMRYITYVHMMSEDNWRRFRSPEDNGREMLEIFLYDTNDSHVPTAGQALKNWKLNTDSDTLEVGLNQNREPLNLFGTVVVNGDDFYRELVKSDLFTQGVIKRLVHFFFPKYTQNQKANITQKIMQTHPETWQDILLQIVFSEDYLLHNERAKSAEENFFSLSKKMDFKHNRSTFYYLKDALEDMHQASMKYKLGKTNRVPLDTLSFAHYHKYIREEILLRKSNPLKIDDYTAWSRHGWGTEFIDLKHFNFNINNTMESLDSFINYIFKTITYRNATPSELQYFRAHMTYVEDSSQHFHWAFNMFATYDDASKQIREREKRRRNIAMLVLDYLSRLDATYTQKEVN